MDDYHISMIAQKLKGAMCLGEAHKVRDLLATLTRANVAEAHHPELRTAANAARMFLMTCSINNSRATPAPRETHRSEPDTLREP